MFRSSDSSQNDITISSVRIGNTRFSPARLSHTSITFRTLLRSLLSHANETLRVRNPVKLRQIAHEIRIRLERNELVVRIATAPFFPISVSHDIAPRRNKEAMADLELGEEKTTHCIKKHSVSSSGRKERTLPLLLRTRCQLCACCRRKADVIFGLAYKLFNAMQSLRGTMPYQQLPPQLIWSQRRTPPMLRFTRGLADVVVRSRAAVARRACIVGRGYAIVICSCSFDGLCFCDVAQGVCRGFWVELDRS